jgi:hypothetical protein
MKRAAAAAIQKTQNAGKNREHLSDGTGKYNTTLDYRETSSSHRHCSQSGE